MRFSPILTIVFSLFSIALPGCNNEDGQHKVLAARAQAKTVTITHQYVCQIQSQRNTKIRALKRGYLDVIPVKAGQQIKEGDPMFNVISTLYQAKLDVEMADAHLADMKLNSTKQQYEAGTVSQKDAALRDGKLAKAKADANLASAKAQLAADELNFATVKAPFDGIVGRMSHHQGSLVDEGEVLTTLYDNSSLCVYFNVPEARYLEYTAEMNQHKDDLQVELELANGSKFPEPGRLAVTETDTNSTAEKFPLRADFANPERLLRHGQSGNVLIRRVVKDAVVIPQQAIFENNNERYVYVIDREDVVHRREIVIQDKLDDQIVIKQGVAAGEKIVLEAERRLRDGDKVQYKDPSSEQAVAKRKGHEK